MSDSKQYDYDLLVIGGGSGGLAAAQRAASYGAKVAIAEQKALGGTCVNRGCIAKRMMVYAADFPGYFDAATHYGWSAYPSDFDWSVFAKAMHQYIERLNQSYLKTLEAAKIQLLGDRAMLQDPHTVQVGDRQVTADKILLAVGGKPIFPKIPGIEHALTSDDMFRLEALPKRLAIVGGGYIGVEFGSVLQGLGCDVTLLDVKAEILEGFDDDVRATIHQGLTQRGIEIWCGTTLKALEREGTGFRLTLDGDNCPETLTADLVLCAIGRQPNLEDLGLDAAGIAVKDGAIQVSDFSRTTQANIYAVGDCTDRMALTPVARAEGQAFADTVFGDRPLKIDYQWVPSAVYARPEAASIGFTEAQAKDKFGEAVRCYHSEFQPLFHAVTQSDRIDQKVQLKLVVNRDTDRIWGVHMLGDRAAEIIQTLAIAVKLGITREQLHDTIGIHPTEGEELYSL
jgi:glutathione reductase (NADPH)